jgi:hypothetical protein
MEIRVTKIFFERLLIATWIRWTRFANPGREQQKLPRQLQLNPILEDEMISALHGDSDHESILRDMADRHMEAAAARLQAKSR